jgi:hypothetical protein
MITIERLKAEIEVLEEKAMIYYNELGDKEAYERVMNAIRPLNALILDLMVKEQEKQRKQALID